MCCLKPPSRNAAFRITVYKGLGFFDAEEIKDVLALVSYLADSVSNLRAAALLRSRIVRISDEGLKILAPDLAGAITGELPAAADQLADDDRERLRLVRESAGPWIDLADQWPAAELIDRVLAESAYAVEIAGPGFAQARENLKKIRGLVRRIQNRGYATLSRLSDYFAGLVAGGDESNAIIDAADAVNLMTVRRQRPRSSRSSSSRQHRQGQRRHFATTCAWRRRHYRR